MAALRQQSQGEQDVARAEAGKRRPRGRAIAERADHRGGADCPRVLHGSNHSGICRPCLAPIGLQRGALARHLTSVVAEDQPFEPITHPLARIIQLNPAAPLIG